MENEHVECWPITNMLLIYYDQDEILQCLLCSDPGRSLRSVTLSFVQSSAFLIQPLQVTGIHLQPVDQVLHVALMFLVVQTIQNQIRKSFIKKRKLLFNGSFRWSSCSLMYLFHVTISIRFFTGWTKAYKGDLTIFHRVFSIFLKSGLLSGSSSQQFLISMHTWRNRLMRTT